MNKYSAFTEICYAELVNTSDNTESNIKKPNICAWGIFILKYL